MQSSPFQAQGLSFTLGSDLRLLEETSTSLDTQCCGWRAPCARILHVYARACVCRALRCMTHCSSTRAVPSAMNSAHALFDFHLIYETIFLVPFTEGVSGDEPELERDAASCGLARNHAPGRHPATPPFRHYERNARMRYVKSESIAPLCNAQGFRRGGPVANKPPQWSAERRAPPGCADCASWSARGREAQRSAPAGLRHWPAKGASQAPERLSALRSLTLVRGNKWLGEQMSRENDDACNGKKRR